MVRILLVEDDEILLDLISEYLSENGYKVTTSDNAKDALDLAYEQNFDLLILERQNPTRRWLFTSFFLKRARC